MKTKEKNLLFRIKYQTSGSKVYLYTINKVARKRRTKVFLRIYTGAVK